VSVEIEAKMKVSDIAALEASLEAAGAKRVATLLETNTYFDTPAGSLKMSDQGLRIRVERNAESGRDTVTITHKGPRAQGKIKSRTETELIVADARIAAEMLAALGYVQVLSFDKRRRRWDLDGCHVDIDSLPYIGDFVEIEGPNEATVLRVRTALQLGHSPLIRASYISMLMTHLAENHIRSEHVKLEAN